MFVGAAAPSVQCTPLRSGDTLTVRVIFIHWPALRSWNAHWSDGSSQRLLQERRVLREIGTYSRLTNRVSSSTRTASQLAPRQQFCATTLSIDQSAYQAPPFLGRQAGCLSTGLYSLWTFIHKRISPVEPRAIYLCAALRALCMMDYDYDWIPGQ